MFETKIPPYKLGYVFDRWPVFEDFRTVLGLGMQGQIRQSIWAVQQLEVISVGEVNFELRILNANNSLLWALKGR